MGLLSGLLGRQKPKTAEELAADVSANNKIAEELAAKPSYKVTNIHDSQGFDGGWSQESVGQDINMQTDRKGRQFFTTDSSGDPQSVYMQNPHNGKWFGNYGKGGMGTGNTGISLGQVQATPAASPGGGGEKKKKPRPDPNKDIRPSPTPGKYPTGPADTGTILGDTYDHMYDWRPISSNGQGGTQPMNPLVDPNAWLHQVDPKWGQINDPGIYVNPAIQQGMLAANQSAQTGSMSMNPYSLLG